LLWKISIFFADVCGKTVKYVILLLCQKGPIREKLFLGFFNQQNVNGVVFKR